MLNNQENPLHVAGILYNPIEKLLRVAGILSNRENLFHVRGILIFMRHEAGVFFFRCVIFLQHGVGFLGCLIFPQHKASFQWFV